MQRWMLWSAAGVVGLVLLLFGAKYARKQYYLGKPDKVWVPIVLRADISMTDQQVLAKQFDERLRSDEILRKVVVDIGLQKKFGLATEDATVKELARRLFVEAGTADTPNGSLPSVNIGFRGTGHEHDLLGEAAMRIIKDAWRMIGIDPVTGQPTGKQPEQPEQPSLLPPDSF